MSASESIFLVVGSIGLVLLLVTFLMGETTELGHETEVHAPEGGTGHTEAGAEHGDGSYIPTWLSTKVLYAAMIGFGIVGFTTSYYGVAAFLAWLLAFAGAAALGAAVLYGVLRPLARQQYNSLIGRQSYVGSRGRVTLAIPSDGFGQVSFHDSNGARIMEIAVSVGEALPQGSRVIIIDVTPTRVVVERDPLPVEEI